MASQPGLFNFQGFTSLGDLGDSMRLYTYAPSTTTQKIAYTDEAGTISHTYTSDGIGGLYIALNARGELPAPLWLTSGGYDLRLTNAFGVTIWTRRAIGQLDILLPLADTSDAAKGDALIGVKSTLTGGVARTQHSKNADNISVKDFGAVGDGTTDDTAAIQAAVNAVAGMSTDGRLHFPAGRYKITSQITAKYGVSMYGDGAKATVIECHDCDGIVVESSTWDQHMAFYQDFGLTAMSGTNRTGFRVATNPYAGEQDGFHLYRIQFFDWDTSIYFGSCWQSTIMNCWIERTNTGIRLDGHAVLNNIDSCQIIRTGGGRGSASNIGVIFGSNDIEANVLQNCFIFGFQLCVELGEPWFCQVKGNTMLAAVTPGAALGCLTFSTVKEKLVIENNIFEGAPGAASVFTAVNGLPQNTSSGASTTIAHNRFFDDTSAGASSIGLQINTSVTTNQNNVHVFDNNFVGFLTNDIRLDNPQNITLRENDCRSTAPTNSIAVVGGVVAPVRVIDNQCFKAISLEAAYYADGSIVKSGNMESGVWTAPDLIGATWTPTDASGAGLTFTVTQAKYTRINARMYVVTGDITWPVTADGSVARVGGMPATPNATYTGAVSSLTSSSGAVAAVTSSATATFSLFDTAGANRTNANMSGKRISFTVVFSS